MINYILHFREVLKEALECIATALANHAQIGLTFIRMTANASSEMETVQLKQSRQVK